MHEQRVTRTYHKELGLSLVVYALLLVASIRYGRPMDDGPLRTAVLLAPMLGFGLMIRAAARQLARVDEYIRQYTLENIALAAAITAALTFSYGFLETAGYPRLTMFSVWIALGSAWLVVTLARGALQR